MALNTKKFMNQYLKIQDKEGKVLNFEFNPLQERIYETIRQLRKDNKPPRIIILKARQMGCSTFTEGLFFTRTMLKPNTKTGIITHLETATTNLFEMSKFYLNNLPEELKPQIRASNAKELIFDTKDGKGLNSKFKCMTATDEGVGRSDTFHNLHISEYAFWKGDKKKILSALLQAVPNTLDSIIIIESTANGYNEFKDLWDDAIEKRNNYVPLFFPWFDMPDYKSTIRDYDEFHAKMNNDKEARELKKRFNLTNEQLQWRFETIRDKCGGDIRTFHQEYPSFPEEAFLSTGAGVFDNDLITSRLTRVIPPCRVGYFDYDYDGLHITNIKWVDDNRGAIKMYGEAKKGYPYVIGGDTAGDGSDYFVAQVVDNTNGQQVAVLRRQYDEDVYVRQVYCLGQYYNKALIGLETNFSTFPTKELARLNYPSMYVRMSEDTYSGLPKKSYGFQTNTKTRPAMIANLVQIVRDEISLINDTDTLREMLTFVRDESFKPVAQVGKHDDCIMALAIAYYIREQQSFLPFTTEAEPVEDWITRSFNKNTKDSGGILEW